MLDNSFLVERFGQHISRLFFRIYLVDRNLFGIIDITSEMVESDVQVLGSRSKFWNLRNLKCTAVVFENAAVYLGLAHRHWETSRLHLLYQVHYRKCIPESV